MKQKLNFLLKINISHKSYYAENSKMDILNNI